MNKKFPVSILIKLCKIIKSKFLHEKKIQNSTIFLFLVLRQQTIQQIITSYFFKHLNLEFVVKKKTFRIEKSENKMVKAMWGSFWLEWFIRNGMRLQEFYFHLLYWALFLDFSRSDSYISVKGHPQDVIQYRCEPGGDLILHREISELESASGKVTFLIGLVLGYWLLIFLPYLNEFFAFSYSDFLCSRIFVSILIAAFRVNKKWQNPNFFYRDEFHRWVKKTRGSNTYEKWWEYTNFWMIFLNGSKIKLFSKSEIDFRWGQIDPKQGSKLHESWKRKSLKNIVIYDDVDFIWNVLCMELFKVVKGAFRPQSFLDF